MQRMIACLLVVPAMALALAAGAVICLSSRGSMLLRTPRVGKDGITFHMFKLRTMVEDAELRLNASLVQDPVLLDEWNRYGRLTRDRRVAGNFARLVRRSSIDELPQILNVAFGQMNLVGPRPLPADVVATMLERNRTARHTVLPGMTGLWQVLGRSDLSIERMGRLDSFYVRRRSAKLDLLILARTVRAVIGGRGAY
jgi:lipopolysaccharide/colanic/teichoic acid biosynthesis glycosyltransferase